MEFIIDTIKTLLTELGRLVMFISKHLVKYFIKLFTIDFKKVKPKKKKAKKKRYPSIKLWMTRKKKGRFFSNLIKGVSLIFRDIKNFWGKIRGFVLGAAFTLIFIFIPFEIYKWFKELPSPDLLVVKSLMKSTRIYDRNDRLLYEIYVDKNFEPVNLGMIPQHAIDATIAVEDTQFYQHSGLRLDSIIRAARETLFEDNLQGGSTITQQLIKNVLLTPERTLSRKIKEAVLSLLVEEKYTKDQILEMYLNNIPYGGNAWGIQSASNKFFGKDIWELSLAESSLLAGLPSAPSVYSPLYDYEKAKDRQKYVLDRMAEQNYITQEEADSAYGQPLNFAEQTEYIRAPHFVNYVRKELESKYGKRFAETGGLTVKTSLDLDLQEKVQQVVAEEVEKAARFNISNGAAVVLDPKTSEILAYAGSVDFFKEDWGAYDVVTAYRQPGSSIKPVTYSLAFSAGLTPANIIEDSAVTYRNPGTEPYTPKNYDGKYHGKVTLRAALANSYNIPAVKIANIVGPDNIVSLGKELGLKNWEVDDSYGLSVTLGGKEVRLLDLSNVYATFARKGTYKETTPFISIKDSKGYEIYNNSQIESTEVLSEEVSYLIWHILSDNNARVPAFGTSSSLVIPGYKIAVKTGTTDNIKDNWTFGFTPSYVAGVWVGNNDGEPMNRYLASGLSGAAPMWNRIMTIVLEDKPNEVFDMPEGVFVKTDEECNKSEVFIKGTNIPETLCPQKEDENENKEDKDREY